MNRLINYLTPILRRLIRYLRDSSTFNWIILFAFKHMHLMGLFYSIFFIFNFKDTFFYSIGFPVPIGCFSNPGEMILIVFMAIMAVYFYFSAMYISVYEGRPLKINRIHLQTIIITFLVLFFIYSIYFKGAFFRFDLHYWEIGFDHLGFQNACFYNLQHISVDILKLMIMMMYMDLVRIGFLYIYVTKGYAPRWVIVWFLILVIIFGLSFVDFFNIFFLISSLISLLILLVFSKK